MKKTEPTNKVNNGDTIFDEKKIQKKTDKELVKKAHKQEKAKMKSGEFRYVLLDSKTRVLRRVV